uniref:Putative secreted protein n=1 Tax=Anopheles darlingi TaxID=43151 RepID=A0A2M4DCA0_ANODA
MMPYRLCHLWLVPSLVGHVAQEPSSLVPPLRFPLPPLPLLRPPHPPLRLPLRHPLPRLRVAPHHRPASARNCKCDPPAPPCCPFYPTPVSRPSERASSHPACR